MATVLLAIGLVLCVEGLVFALTPSLLEDVMDALRRIPVDVRRLIGLGALTLGVALVWLAKGMGA